ncbi:MAG: hypothetical protein AAFO62_01145 [Pseudomonadota bacterium]
MRDESGSSRRAGDGRVEWGMDAFQHEASLLREVEEGLRLRLSGHADWAIFLRSGMPTEALSRDARFTAWSYAVRSARN